MKASIIGSVESGVLKYNQKTFSDLIKGFEGKRVELTISKAKKERSNQQNRYYWGCVIPILRNSLKDLGNVFTPEQVHDLLKYKFLKEDVHIKEGEFIEKVKSSTELSTSEFMDYIDEIQKWSAEFFGVVIPDPNEQIEFEL